MRCREDNAAENFITFVPMKQWLTILMLLWAAATVNAGDERKSAPCRTEIYATVLTQDNGGGTPAEQVPLLATSCPGTTQLSGTGHDPVRGNRNPGSPFITAMQGHSAAATGHTPERRMRQYRCSPPNVRCGDRYIYYLRRIII